MSRKKMETTTWEKCWEKSSASAHPEPPIVWTAVALANWTTRENQDKPIIIRTIVSHNLPEARVNVSLRLLLVLLIIGRKSGASFLRQKQKNGSHTCYFCTQSNAVLFFLHQVSELETQLNQEKNEHLLSLAQVRAEGRRYATGEPRTA